MLVLDTSYGRHDTLRTIIVGIVRSLPPLPLYVSQSLAQQDTAHSVEWWYILYEACRDFQEPKRHVSYTVSIEFFTVRPGRIVVGVGKYAENKMHRCVLESIVVVGGHALNILPCIYQLDYSEVYCLNTRLKLAQARSHHRRRKELVPSSSTFMPW
jgi:hypothetical protein